MQPLIIMLRRRSDYRLLEEELETAGPAARAESGFVVHFY